jgi:hypothetical protein
MSFNKTIFRELRIRRIDCSPTVSGYFLDMAVSGQTLALGITGHKEGASVSRLNAQSRREPCGEQTCRICTFGDQLFPIPTPKRVGNSFI